MKRELLIAAAAGVGAYFLTDKLVQAQRRRQVVRPEDLRFAVYTVQPGDTLTRIAQLAGTTVARLVEINQLANPNLIRVGQTLLVPTGE